VIALVQSIASRACEVWTSALYFGHRAREAEWAAWWQALASESQLGISREPRTGGKVARSRGLERRSHSPPGLQFETDPAWLPRLDANQTQAEPSTGWSNDSERSERLRGVGATCSRVLLRSVSLCVCASFSSFRFPGRLQGIVRPKTGDVGHGESLRFTSQE
jgi:hypothetical protein